MSILGVFKKKSDQNSSSQDKVLDSQKKEEKKKKSISKSQKEDKDLTIEEITTGKKDKKGKKTVSKKDSKHDTKEAYRVLIRPLVTEKSTYLQAENKYLFEVNLKANKNEVKKAIFHVYGIWPTKVNISNLRGKDVRYGRTSGVTRARKKAIVTLPDGESIQIYEGV